MMLPKLKVPPKILSVRNYKRFETVAFTHNLNNVPFHQIKDISQDADEMWVLWKSFFLDILNKHAPITNIKIKGNKTPYITSEVKNLIRQRDYLRTKANKTGSRILRQAYSQIRARVNQKLYNLRKTTIPTKLNNINMI